MNSIKVSAFALFFLLAALATGCASQPSGEASQAAEEPAQQESSDYKTFASKQYSIEYPANWQIREQQQLGIISFISPKEAELDTFRENFNIYIADAQPGFTLDDYTQLGVEQLEEALEGFKLTSLTSTTLAGFPARKIEYTTTSRQEKLNYVQMTTMKGKFVYTITYSGISSKYGTYEYAVKKAIQSFRIT